MIFGCIPLGEIIKAVSDMTDTPEQIPKFGSEASTQVESFINGLIRLYGFVADLASQPGNIGDAAVTAFKSTLDDLLQQGLAYSAAQMAPVQAAATQLESALNDVASASSRPWWARR